MSPATRLVAAESNATTCPVALADGALARALLPSPCLPFVRTLTNSATPGAAAAAAANTPSRREALHGVLREDPRSRAEFLALSARTTEIRARVLVDCERLT